MARTVARYVFAALLAFLSTQAVAPSIQFSPTAQIVYCSVSAEERVLQELAATRPPSQSRQTAPAYASCPRPKPKIAALFQRPPPASPFFS